MSKKAPAPKRFGSLKRPDNQRPRPGSRWRTVGGVVTASGSRLNRRLERPPRRGPDSFGPPLEPAKLAFLPLHHFIEAAAITTAALFLALFLMRGNHQEVSLGYQITRLSQKRQSLEEDNRRLRLELANLTSLDKLEIIAKEHLGLVSPQNSQIQVID